jgi:hypothetical protein
MMDNLQGAVFLRESFTLLDEFWVYFHRIRTLETRNTMYDKEML